MDNGQIRTIADIVKESGRTTDAIRKAYKRQWPDRPFGAAALLQPDERDYFKVQYGIGKQKSEKVVVARSVPPPVIELKEEEHAQQPEFVSALQFTILDAINFSDMLLILSGLVIMLHGVGLFVAGIIVAFFFDTVRTVKNPAAWSSRSLGLSIAWLITLVSGLLHFVTFRTVLLSTSSDLPVDRDTMAILLSVVVCTISLASLYQSSNKTQDKLWEQSK